MIISLSGHMSVLMLVCVLGVCVGCAHAHAHAHTSSPYGMNHHGKNTDHDHLGAGYRQNSLKGMCLPSHLQTTFKNLLSPSAFVV